MSKVTKGECISPELSNEMQNLRGGKEIVLFYQKESCVRAVKQQILRTLREGCTKNLCNLP